MINGYNGLGLDIDLSTGKIREIGIADTLIKQYVGGRGLGTYFLTQNLPPDTDPLSEQSLLVISAGGLGGSRAPAAGRFSVTFKSPLTGTIASANSGGRWGSIFKRSGFDICLIRGRSAVPVYILIAEGDARILEAGNLWGKTLPELSEDLAAIHSSSAGILAIGPAGENRVLFASLMNDIHRTAGRGGGGAVMGAKNLKAIVVNGQKTFAPARPEEYRNGLYQAEKLVKNFPVTARALPQLGTPGLVRLIHAHDMLPSRNFSSTRHKTGEVMEISGEKLRSRLLVRRRGCYNCSVACGRVTRVKSRKGEGPEYETIALLGPNLGIYDLDRVAVANYLCNENGMDTISLGGTLALATELFQKGIIGTADTGGRDLDWGRGELLIQLTKATARREGLGEWLARGSLRLGRQFGREDLAMAVKGLELPGYDPRASLHQALGYATSPRGGCHLKGGYLVCLGFFGGAREVNRFLVDSAADHCVEAQDSGCVSDMLGICRFLSFSLSDHELARIYSGYTGLDTGPEDLKATARRIQNIERSFNIRAGFTAADDTLPERMFREKIMVDGKRRAIDYDGQFKVMLDKYYQVRGWDRQGVPAPVAAEPG